MALETELNLRDHVAAVPSDATVYGNAPARPTPFSAIFVGVAGSVTIRSLKGNLATFTAPVGMLMIAGTQIMASGTTATSMVLIFGGGP